MNSGFLLIDKPAGLTSFDICARLRKQLDTKRIGHTGTLDPFATGLLVVAIGKATRLIPYLEKARKIYQATIILGQTSSTLDPESDITQLPEPASLPDQASIQALINQEFNGSIQQVPPQFSALKVNGQRAYKLARQGTTVELKSRATTIHNIEILNYHWPKLKLGITVDAGFYVRSLARDLGSKLAGGGLCQQLRRIAVGNTHMEPLPLTRESWRGFNNKKEVEIFSDLSKITPTDLLDPKNILDLPTWEISPDRTHDFQQGRAIFHPSLDSLQNETLVTHQQKTIGLGMVNQGNLQPKIVF